MSKRASSSPVSSPGGHSPDSMTPPPSKRIRPSDNGGALVPHEKTSDALVSTSEKVSSALILREGSRTSSLPNPEMILTGHEAAVYTLSFSPSGDYLASSGMDRNIFLWDVHNEFRNSNVLSGHKSAVLQVCWANSQSILSCSADKTSALWDANVGARIRRFSEHTAIVNSIAAASNNSSSYLFSTASDDCSTILWDSRSKHSISSAFFDYQQLATALSADGFHLFSAGIDNIIRRYDTRNGLKQPDLELHGCTDSVTGLSLNPEGTSILANSMDCNLHIFDVRPFALSGNVNRQKALLPGVHHGAEKLLLRCAWSSDGDFIAAGSADRLVHLWDAARGTEICSWPGHKASVNEVVFHPNQPVLASASSDKTIVLGEFHPV